MGRGDRQPRDASDRRSREGTESLELVIDSLAAGGDGVARGPDGRVVFVPFTAPGDRVRVRIVAVRRGYALGRVEQLLQPGSARTEPVCPVFGSCGGCTWQHVEYATQLEAKAAILGEALRRIGKLPLPGPIRIEASPAAYGYRGRARVLVTQGRVGFRRRRSHALCPTVRCPILVPSLDRALGELARHPPDEDGQWELVAGATGVRAAPLDGGGAGAAIEIEVRGDRMHVSRGVFVQANLLLLDPLAAKVQDAAGSGELVLELFAGAGFLTLGIARRFRRMIAVESHADSVRDLRHNCRVAGMDHVEVFEASAEGFLQRRGGLLQRVDVAVLDPPRRGLSPGTAEALAAVSPTRIVMLSCDPATLARDLATLHALGYALVGVCGFDLFPQTPHVEALAVLERDPAPGGAGIGGTPAREPGPR